MENRIIKTDRLTKEYDGIKCVNKLHLEIPKGSIYGFLGSNGAGKTTTMKMLVGLTPPSDGEIEIFGMPLVNNKTEILRKTGSLIENPSYYGHLTGYENLKLLEILLNIPDERSLEVLKLVDLYTEKDKKVKDYSLGMKQRLALAMALLREPKLLILDEPTNGLDPEGTRKIRKLLKKLAHENEITIMISSHQLAEIEKIADYIGILQNGSLIFEGSLEELNQYIKGQTTIETSDNEKALKLFSSLNPVLKQDKLIFKNLKKENIPLVINRLVHEGLKIYSVTNTQPSLEDLYFEIIGKNYDSDKSF